MLYDASLIAETAIPTANDNGPHHQLMDEAVYKAKAAVRILDCYGSRRTIAVQNGTTPPPIGRGCERLGQYYSMTDRAWNAYRATITGDVVCDF